MAILASPCNLDAYFPAYCLQQLRVCGPTKLSASTPVRLASIPVPRFLPATRRQRLGQGLGILSYTTGTGFAFLHPGVSPAFDFKQSIMQSTKTCSPVAPSAFDRRNTTRLNLFHLAGYSSNLQVYVNRLTGNRKLSEWQPLLAAKPRTNHLAFAFEAGLVSV